MAAERTRYGRYVGKVEVEVTRYGIELLPSPRSR